jgi:hypothetical protein
MKKKIKKLDLNISGETNDCHRSKRRKTERSLPPPAAATSPKPQNPDNVKYIVIIL